MYRKNFKFPLILGILAIIMVGCSTRPVESLPLEMTTISPTESNLSPSPQVDETAISSPTDEGQAVDPGLDSDSLRFDIVPEESEARYRVQEQLAGFALPNDAVGSTQAISGMVVISQDGSIDTSASKFEVDLSTLTSDQSRRDNYLRSNTLRTNQYPLAVFVPDQVTGLPQDLPQSGEVVFSLIGEMTLLDVTRPVEWQVTGNLNENTFFGLATTSFTFGYFELDQPRVASVLSIEDNIRLEVDFTLQRVDG